MTKKQQKLGNEKYVMKLLREACRLGEQMNELGDSAPYSAVNQCRGAYASVTGQLGRWAPTIIRMLRRPKR